MCKARGAGNGKQDVQSLTGAGEAALTGAGEAALVGAHATATADTIATGSIFGDIRRHWDCIANVETRTGCASGGEIRSMETGDTGFVIETGDTGFVTGDVEWRSNTTSLCNAGTFAEAFSN